MAIRSRMARILLPIDPNNISEAISFRRNSALDISIRGIRHLAFAPPLLIWPGPTLQAVNDMERLAFKPECLALQEGIRKDYAALAGSWVGR